MEIKDLEQVDSLELLLYPPTKLGVLELAGFGWNREGDKGEQSIVGLVYWVVPPQLPVCQVAVKADQTDTAATGRWEKAYPN